MHLSTCKNFKICYNNIIKLKKNKKKGVLNANSEDEALEKGNALAEERYGITEGAFTTVTQVAK